MVPAMGSSAHGVAAGARISWWVRKFGDRLKTRMVAGITSSGADADERCARVRDCPGDGARRVATSQKRTGGPGFSARSTFGDDGRPDGSDEDAVTGMEESVQAFEQGDATMMDSAQTSMQQSVVVEIDDALTVEE